MTWIAYLQGRDHDLGVLTAILPDGDLSFDVAEAGSYIMQSTEFDVMTSATDVRAAAARLLDTANGVAAMRDPTFQPVAVTGQVRDGEGRHTHVVVVDSMSVVSIMSPAVVSAGDGGRPALAPSEADFVALARRDADVADALRHFAKETSWFTLYNVYEVICHDLGGEHKLRTSGLADAEALRTFTESANRLEISGDAARHARIRGEPSGRSTDVVSGREMIRALLRAWMVAKLS